ncbi:MAG: hypothetical protein VX589_16145 [Myxococcota bacterium]|nr:hypothetical protein [Myxococcota bacterium]
MTLFLSFHPVCALIFGCGCLPIGLGDHQTCLFAPWLIDTPPAICPWCAMSGLDLGGIAVLVVAGSLACASRCARLGLKTQLLVSVFSTVALLFLMGVTTAIIDGYVTGGIAQWVHETCGLEGG